MQDQIGMGFVGKFTWQGTLVDSSIFHGRLLHDFHLWVETRFQLPPLFTLTNYIGIWMEPWHPWMTQVNSWLLRVNFVTLRPRNSFYVLKSGAPAFCATPSHCPMQPWVMTMCFSHRTFRGFAFWEFSLLLISNILMPEIMKWPLLDHWLDPLQTDGQDHPFEKFVWPSLNQELTFI